MDKKILSELIAKIKTDKAWPKEKTAVLKELNKSLKEFNDLFEDLLKTIRDEKK